MAKFRLIVLPKDLMIIFELSERSARTYMKNLRLAFDKKEHQFVTFRELADYADLPLEDILKRFQ